ncbi:MAG: hypothetical protein R3261_08735 [Alphaproteobacteria bacterium]|nr:hypothetical protein [Alphaproteobacteria bacterium]
MRFPLKIRILPIFFVIVLLMFSVKFGDFFFELSSQDEDRQSFTAEDLALLTSGQAQAQQSPATDGEGAMEIDDPSLAENQNAAPELNADNLPEGMEPSQLLDQEDQFSAESIEDMSPGEIRMLHDLVARRESLEKRERVIVEREALLRSAEQQLIDKQQQLEEIKASIESLMQVYKQEQTEEAKRLVKIYSSMKPKSAARIFDEMDMRTLIQVFRGMKERTIAPIMAAMNAEKARLVTRRLAEVDDLEDMATALE